MNDTNDENLLWHTTAQKLIKYAGKFRSSDEFERHVGYLLLDVGVETFLKSFLIMPNIKTKSPFKERERIVKGIVDKNSKNSIVEEKTTLTNLDSLNFHTLVEAVKQVDEPKINEKDLRRTEHYHNIRNKIYHQGEGIIPAKEKFDEYLQLAERLLATLLNTDKQSEDHLTDDEAFWLDIKFKLAVYRLQKDLQEFQLNIGVAAEAFAPKITSKRVEKGVKKIKQKYPDDEWASVSERYEMQLIRIREFQKLTGTDFDDGDFIDEVLNDITYLYLVMLLDNKVVDDSDIDNYLEYNNLVERFHDRPDDASQEDREKLVKLLDWAKKLQEKFDALAPKQESDGQEEED